MDTPNGKSQILKKATAVKASKIVFLIVKSIFLFLTSLIDFLLRYSILYLIRQMSMVNFR